MAKNNKLTSSISNAININTYVYSGVNSSGTTIKGECRGKTKSAAKQQLQSQGINVKRISKKSESIFNKNKVRDKDIIHFTRYLSTMITSGVPIIQSLEVCINSSSNAAVADMITKLKTSIESGHNFSEALSLYPKYFNSFYRNLLKIGESSGKLDVMLSRIADYLEKMNLLKSKFKKALLYPAMVVLVSILVTAILLIYVVPQFESMFQNFNAELPLFTRMVLDVSRALQKYWFHILTVLMIIYNFVDRFIRNSSSAQLFIDKLMLRLPIIGSIINKICLARFARTIATMLASGIPLLNSLPAAGALVGNKVYEKAIKQIHVEVENGLSLSKAMLSTNTFNPMIIQMTSIGENSGSLDDMLLKIAELYETEVDDTVSNISSIIEPIIILIISVIVGSLIIAMYLPIFTLGSVI